MRAGTPRGHFRRRAALFVFGLLLPASFAAAAAAAAAAELQQSASPYPPARRADQVDVFHGVTVADPYRWLEDSDSPETRAWIDAQNRLSSTYLEAAPGREALRRRLTELWDYERYTPPVVRAGRYFFTRNDGLQNQAVLYVADGFAGAPRAVLDANTFSADGTIALTAWEPSEDGSLIAYGTSSGGSDWEEWRVREVATGRDLPERLEWVKFSAASWTHDGKSFFYSRYDAPAAGEALEAANYYQKVYYHRLGTPQSEDRLVYERRDHKEWSFQGTVTDDGRYLVIHVWKGTEIENGVLYQDLTAPGAPVVELLTSFEAAYLFLGNDGPVFWFQTNLDAPRGRVMAIDTRTPERARWRELVPQGEDTLESARVVHDGFLVHYLHDAHSRLVRFDLAGRPLGELALPGLGTAARFGGRRADRESFFTFTSFTTPTTVYRVALDRAAVEVFRQPRIAFTPSDYETRQVFFTSKDGTRVPMFITRRKGLVLDGRNPTYLYGYGGFNIPFTPTFSVQNLVWMEMGGVLAIPNLRGGGEYGEAWHEAGSKLRKQNVFDDAYAAAEWLIANRYTARDRLAIGGHRNGGLLAGAAVTQRPDLAIHLRCPQKLQNPGNGCFSVEPAAHHVVKGYLDLCASFFDSDRHDDADRGRLVAHELLHHLFVQYGNIWVALQDRHYHGHGLGCGLKPKSDAAYGEDKIRHLATYRNSNGNDCGHLPRNVRNNDTYAQFVKAIGDRVYRGTLVEWPLPTPPTPQPPECERRENCLCEDASSWPLNEYFEPDGDWRADRWCPDNDGEMTCMETSFGAHTEGICKKCDTFRRPGCDCDDGRPCAVGSCFGDQTFNGGVGHCFKEPSPLVGLPRRLQAPLQLERRLVLQRLSDRQGALHGPLVRKARRLRLRRGGQGLPLRRVRGRVCDSTADCPAKGYPSNFECQSHRCEYSSRRTSQHARAMRYHLDEDLSIRGVLSGNYGQRRQSS